MTKSMDTLAEGAYHIETEYAFQPWAVVLSAALFFFYEFIQMNMFNAIDPSLIKAFSVNATQLGNLSATYFYGNIVFLFIAGILLDRFSTRRLLVAAMTLCVAFTYLFSLSQYLWQAELCRFLTGIGSTFCMLTAVRLASRWFPPRRIALVIGLVLTFAMTGGVVAQTPMTLLTAHFGWRHAVMINATLGVLFIGIIFCFVRDYPKNIAATQAQEKENLKNLGFLRSIYLVIKNKQNWLAGIYANFLSLPVIVLGAAWGSEYLMHVHGFSHHQTTYVTSMIFFGTIIGSPLLGWVSDVLGYRKLPMIIGALLTLLVMLVIIYYPGLTLSGLMVLFFILGLVTGCQVIAFPLVVESNPMTITTTAEGLTCTLVMMNGFFQLLFGWVLDLTWDGTMAQGLRVYNSHSFQTAVLIIPVAFLLSFILSFFLKETHCREML